MGRTLKMIYLINPQERRILENAGDRIPIGLLSIAANLQRENHQVKVFDMNHTTRLQLGFDYCRDSPSAVGISVYTSPVYKEAVELSTFLRKLKPSKFIAGGYHATALPFSLFPHFDTVVKGEGEFAFSQAMQTIGVVNGIPPILEELVSPDYELLDMSNYGINQSGMRTGTVITSRGCPMSCAFCGKMSRHVRYEPIEKVRDQITTLKNLGFDAIYFLDDVFTLKKDRMRKIVSGMSMPFRATTRADLLDEEKIEILAESGCDWLSMGLESGDNRILKNACKSLTIEQSREAVQTAAKYGINVKAFFIIGLPGETQQTACKTINFARELKNEGLTTADFYYLTPFPGTPIWNDPDRFGIEIIDRDYTKYVQCGPEARCYINTEELSAHKIENLVGLAREVFNCEITGETCGCHNGTRL